MHTDSQTCMVGWCRLVFSSLPTILSNQLGQNMNSGCTDQAAGWEGGHPEQRRQEIAQISQLLQPPVLTCTQAGL